uniref:Ferrous iron transport protein A n=1 Tax=candidate division WOR-3 bacterium TaxID=2052148 RepID=A0A7V4E3D4_UNCW3
MAIVKNVKSINLKELKINRKGKIKEIGLSFAYKRRLNFLGIKKNSIIEKIGKIKNLHIFKAKNKIIVLPNSLAKKILIKEYG